MIQMPDSDSETLLPGETLQHEIDRAARLGGGEVRPEPGTYLLEDSLHLRDGVRLRGDGVFLTRKPSVESRLSIYSGYGLYEFAVEEPERFRVGQGVHLTDDHSV